ncbi:MAG: hypothetical protein AB1757_01245 [Acidobacteriota bacterium]
MTSKIIVYLILISGLTMSSDELHAFAKTPSRLPSALVDQLIHDIHSNDKGFRLSKHDIEVIYKNLKFKLRDINGDGVLEFFLWIDHPDWCGAGGNCDYWIYQKQSNKYVLLLNDKQLNAKRTRSHGYCDLISETPMGVLGQNQYRFYTTLYKWDGKKYLETSSGLEIKMIKMKK